MSKTVIKWLVIAPSLVSSLVLFLAFCFHEVRHIIIENNEVLVHSVAQSLMPALLVNDDQQVDVLMKALESYPGVQVAELINAQGASIASYARADQSLDSMTSYELASAVDDPTLVHVMAPITFDGLIVANLYLAVNLWPSYYRVIIWLGLILIVPTLLYIFVKQLRLKLRFEVRNNSDWTDGHGEGFDVNTAVSNAMQEAGISLEYQPIQRMSDGGLFGMEVVVCWRDPSGQTFHVSPSDFVALAEKMNLCLPFDDWLLNSACAQASVWQHQFGPLILTINISASQFNDATFARKIRNICEATQYPHQLLELDVHESVVVREIQQAKQSLQNFATEGLSVTVDDFGLMPASSSVFESLPVKKVKLDRRLVSRTGNDKLVLNLIQTIITNANLHEAQVMVDGLDFAHQYEVLKSAGCILGQGAYFYPPLTTSDFESFLSGRAFDVISRETSDALGKSDKQQAQSFFAI